MAAEHYIAWIERKAYRLRQYLALSPLAILNPLLLAQKMGVIVLSPREVPGLPPQVQDQLLRVDRDSWSAGCLQITNGPTILLFNPTHPSTRLRATIMEELAHLYLKHKGSQFLNNNGTIFRTYIKSEETGAYWVGAAALLPRVVLLNAYQNHVSKVDLARERGVSPQLVGFREKVTKIRLRPSTA